MRDLHAGPGADGGDAVVEAREDVQVAIGFVEDEPCWPAGSPGAGAETGQGGVARTGDEGIVFDVRRRVDSDLARAEAGDVERGAVARDRHAEWKREARVVFWIGAGAARA